QRRRYFLVQPSHWTGIADIGWVRPDAGEMSEEDWKTGFAKSLGVFLSGQGSGLIDAQGEPLSDDDFYIAFNAHYEELTFKIPANLKGLFRIIFNTAEGEPVKPVPKTSAVRVLPQDAATT